jgi:hypothetical protein
MVKKTKNKEDGKEPFTEFIPSKYRYDPPIFLNGKLQKWTPPKFLNGDLKKMEKKYKKKNN